MKNLLFILMIFSILTSGCKQKFPEAKEEKTIRLISPVLAERNLNPFEKSAVAEICESVKLKRELFETYESGSNGATFKLSQRDCNSRFRRLGTYKTQLNTDGQLRYVGNINLISSLVVENNSPLGPICNSYFKQDKPLINIYSQGLKRFLYTFKKMGENLFFQAAIYSLATRQKLKYPFLIDEGIVYTSASAPKEELRGVLYQRTQYIKCDNGVDKYKRQTLKK